MRNFLLLTSILSLGAVFQVSADYTFLHPHTPIELKPVSLQNSYQVASVCFLGNGDCINVGYDNSSDDYTIDTAQQCRNNGYLKECNDGMIIDISAICPYDSDYTKCICNPCEGYSYSYAEATSAGYEVDGSCVSCSEMKYKRKAKPASDTNCRDFAPYKVYYAEESETCIGNNTGETYYRTISCISGFYYRHPYMCSSNDNNCINHGYVSSNQNMKTYEICIGEQTGKTYYDATSCEDGYRSSTGDIRCVCDTCSDSGSE